MRIMFIVDTTFQGGAGRVVGVLADAFAQKGHAVTLLAGAQKSGSPRTYLQNEAVEVIDFLDSVREGKKLVLERISGFRRLFRQYKPDVVVAFLNEFGIIAALAGLGLSHKLIVSERIDPHVSPTNKVLRLLRNPAYAKADALVFQTDDMKAYFPGYIQKKGRVIFNPLSPSLPPVYTGEREKRVVSVGRLTAQKNFAMAINAFAEFSASHPEYIYEIYGDGPLKETLQAQIDSLQLGDKVLLMGHCGDVTQRINRAEMFVMSSDYEGLSNAMIEAMAMGLPCISTDHPIGDAKMLIDHGKNGLLIPVNDQAALLAALCQLAEDADTRESMSRQAATLRQTLHRDAIVEQWLELCRQVTGKQ